MSRAPDSAVHPVAAIDVGRMIQRGKELLHVGLQHMAEAAGEVLAAAYGGVGALALAAGVGIANERPLVDRLQDVDDGVVDDPIPVRGGPDLSGFRLADDEGAIGSGPVGLRGQFLVQRPQFGFEVEVEGGHAGPEALALAGLLGGTQERRERDDLRPEVTVPFHALPPLLLSQPPTSLPISSTALVAKP